MQEVEVYRPFYDTKLYVLIDYRPFSKTFNKDYILFLYIFVIFQDFNSSKAILQMIQYTPCNSVA